MFDPMNLDTERVKNMNTEKQIEFNKVKEIWAGLAITEYAKDYLSRGRQYDNPLAYYDENLDGLSELRDEINRQIRNEAVDDRASYGRQDSGP